MSSRSQQGGGDRSAKEQLKDRLGELEEIIDEADEDVRPIYESVYNSLKDEMEAQS